MENWETCVCFCSSYFPSVCCQGSPRGRVYGSTSAARKKSYLKKSTYKQCEPRQKVNNKTLHKAFFPAVFGEKQEVYDQLHLWEVPSVYRTCFKMFFKAFYYFVQRYC